MTKHRYSVRVGDHQNRYVIERIPEEFYEYWDHVNSGAIFQDYFFMEPEKRKFYEKQYSMPTRGRLDNRRWQDINKLFSTFTCTWNEKVFIEEIGKKPYQGHWFDNSDGIHEVLLPEILPPSKRKGFYIFGYTVEKGMVDFFQDNSPGGIVEKNEILELNEKFDPQKLWIETQELFAGRYLVVRMEYRLNESDSIFLIPNLKKYQDAKKRPTTYSWANVVGRPTGNEFLCKEKLKKKSIS